MPGHKGNKNAVGNKGGRPTKLTPELIKLSKKYLPLCKDTYKTYITGSDSEGNPITATHLEVKLPTLQGFARFLSVNSETVRIWATENIEFSATVDDIKEEQASRLVGKGLSGLYNSSIVKLLLSSNHGMREKVDTDITTQGEKINVFDQHQLNEIARRHLASSSESEKSTR